MPKKRENIFRTLACLPKTMPKWGVLCREKTLTKEAEPKKRNALQQERQCIASAHAMRCIGQWKALH